MCVCVLTDRTEEFMVIPSFSSLKLLKIITPHGLIEIFPFSTHVCLYVLLCKTSFNCWVGVPSAPELSQLHNFPATARKHLLMTDLGGEQRPVAYVVAVVFRRFFASAYAICRSTTASDSICETVTYLRPVCPTHVTWSRDAPTV